jgi:hypothetical protein
MRLMKCSLAIATIVLASPFALGQDNGDEPAADESSERVCVNARSIRNFDAFTDKYMYVQEGSSKHYLFTMRNNCRSLRNANGIAIKDVTGRVCADGFGEVVYRDRMSSQRLATCRIENIERVESKDDAKAIVEARKEAKDNE